MAHQERTILITGATAGLGRELAREYARRPGHLLVHGRSPEKLRMLQQELSGQSAHITPLQADLSELAEVRKLAVSVREATDVLSVLVNNAGIGPGSSDQREESADGFELRLAVNHLAPFALTLNLLPLLRASDGSSRVVNVASTAQTPFDFDDPQLTRNYSGGRAYAHSKFAMIATGFHLAQVLPAEEVTVNSLHPATLMPTALVEEGYGRTIDTLAAGVASTTKLIDDRSLTAQTGRYFSQQEESRALPEAYDPEVQRRLWALSEEWTGLSL